MRGKLNCKSMAVPLGFWSNKQTISPSQASFSPHLFEFQVPGLQRSQIFQRKSQQMKNKKQQNKLPCYRKDSLGPLIYSNAEQTEHLCSRLCQFSKITAGNQSLPFVLSSSIEGSCFSRGSKHSFIQSSTVVLVWILNKNKRLVLVSPLLNYPSQNTSLLPQQL